MKANELMIGDLIYVYGRNKNIFTEPYWYIRKVTADWIAAMARREANDKKLADNGIIFTNQLFIGDTKPIPLTEEILKANGFDYYSDEYVYWLDEDGLEPPFRIFRNSKGVLRISVGYKLVVLRYVHELQHALRQCGLNELADNFKI